MTNELNPERRRRSRRVMPGVLHSFLGTFTSRYSSWDGYWLLGFLVRDLMEGRPFVFDLLQSSAHSVPTSAIEAAKQIAGVRFRSQIVRNGLPMEWIQAATLEIEIEPVSDADRWEVSRFYAAHGMIQAWRYALCRVRLLARAKTDLGRVFERKMNVFASAHDPRLESRSARAE